MISFNSSNNPVLSILFIFILILEMKIKRLFINAKSQHGNLDILKILKATKRMKLLGKILTKEQEEEKYSFKLENLCFETARLVPLMCRKISLGGCDQHLKSAVKWDGTEKKMSAWTEDGKGEYCSMNFKFLCVLVYNVNVYLYVSHS